MSDLPYLNGREIYECANQLEGYVDEGTPDRLAAFLLREGKAANDLADEIVRLRATLDEATETAKILRRDYDLLRDEALEVVRPFSDRAKVWSRNTDNARVSVRLADLRAARRFYEKHNGGSDEQR